MRSVWDENKWAHDAQGEALHFILNTGGIRLIGLDSTIDYKDYGSVTDHLEWLENQLSDACSPPSLLFMHHHVFASGIPTLDETMCRGLPEMEDLMRRAPTDSSPFRQAMYTDQSRVRLRAYLPTFVAPFARLIQSGLEQ
jgi:hypothetical protein